MEDPRLGKMYFGMIGSWFSRLFDRLWRRGLMRSGMVTGLLVALLVVALAIAYHERGLGRLHRLKVKIQPPRQEAPVWRPGGQDAIVLTRSRMIGDSSPELTSVTLLPGRGMNILQITAFVPGKGEINLLASPSVEEATGILTGTGSDAAGQASLQMGGAFEAPWADTIWGTPQSGPRRASTNWKGHAITLPATRPSDAVAEGGLLLPRQSSSADTTAMPDGGQAQAIFNASDFGVHWPSDTTITVALLLSSHTLDITMTARNRGDIPEPIGLGWHPRFAIANENRGQWKIRIPGQMRVITRNNGEPVGKLAPVSGTPYDLTPRAGVKLGDLDLDDCFVALHQDLLDSGPVAELSNPADDYGIRLTALSSTIKAMRVVTPAKASFVTIEPQFNLPDPFGHEWPKDTDTGMVVLQPGQSTQWKVRLELHSLSMRAQER